MSVASVPFFEIREHIDCKMKYVQIFDINLEFVLKGKISQVYLMIIFYVFDITSSFFLIEVILTAE